MTRIMRSRYFGGESQIAVMPDMAQSDKSMHGHEFAEIVLILSGHAMHVTGQVRHRVKTGHVLFINPSRSHAYEETHQFRLANILVHEEVFQEVEKELGTMPGYHALFTLESKRWRPKEFTSHLQLDRAEFRKVMSWLKSLREETEKPTEGGRLLGRCWLILILGLLARGYGRDVADSPSLEMRLGRVLSWIDTNFQQQIRIAELANRTAMSERTFLRRFREATGLSPNNYLIRARIRHAMELLDRRRQNETITDIAFCCGFEDSNYFARQFRKLTGKKPRDYSTD